MNKKRLYGIDMLNLLLAFITFLFHARIHFDCQFGFLQGFIENGNICMSGFFLLSGYTIYYVYNSFDLREISCIAYFYKKRMITLLPAYYTVIIFFNVILLSQSLVKKIVVIPIELLGIQCTYNSLFDVEPNNVTWFVSCIIMCYIVYPIIHIVFTQINNIAKVIIATLCVIILLLSPVVVSLYSLSWTYANPFFRILEFIIGVAIASLRGKSNEKIIEIIANKYTAILSIVWIVLFVSFCDFIGFGSKNTMFLSAVNLIPFAIIIYVVGQIEVGKLFNNRFIAYLRTLTYCFFLSQVFMTRIGNIVFQYISCGNILKILILFMICAVITIMLHELVEKPVKRLLFH